MNDTNPKKPLISCYGKGHSLVKYQWLAAIIFPKSGGLTFYARLSSWQQQIQFYELWDDIPAYPSFGDLLIIAVLGVILALAAGRAIGKMEVHVYSDGIEGYGFKTWDFLPRVRRFELRYEEIISVKKRRRGLSFKSASGRYVLFIREPEAVYGKISEISDGVKQ